MKDIFLSIALAIGPLIFFYLMGLFITWGESWNPGEWEIESRMTTALFQTLWLLGMFFAYLDS